MALVVRGYILNNEGSLAGYAVDTDGDGGVGVTQSVADIKVG